MCRGFPLSFVFELCLQKALQLLLRPVPSLAPCEPSLPHCCSRGREKSEGRGKAFKLVPEFSRILSSAVARCLLVFTIQWEDKDYTRKDLKESQASRTGRDFRDSDSQNQNSPSGLSQSLND